MRYLPVAGHDVPDSHLEWSDLADPAKTAVYEVLTRDFLIDVTGSPFLSAVPSAFTVKNVGGRQCVPLHELESL